MSSFSGIQVEDFRQMLANILGESIYHINWIGYDKTSMELYFQIRSHVDIRTFHEVKVIKRGKVKKFFCEKNICAVEVMEQSRRTTLEIEDTISGGGYIYDIDMMYVIAYISTWIFTILSQNCRSHLKNHLTYHSKGLFVLLLLHFSCWIWTWIWQ